MKIKKQNKTIQKHTIQSEVDKSLEDDYPTPKKWYDSVDDDPKNFENVSEQVLIEMKEEAKKCHDTEVANYNIKNSKTNSNFAWMKTMMTKGTVSDKIAAHTVSIQDDPICNLDTIQNLVNMVKAGKKRECIIVIETLTDMFLNDLLHPHRKLKSFEKRPLSMINALSSGNGIKRRKILSTWYFEDQLKQVYTSFILALNTMAHDTVDNNKEKAISAIHKLLSGNSENEKNLLGYLINKLGDPSQKVASKAIYCLTQLLFKHSNMQNVVLNEVEKLLYRPNISERAQYYSLCFLSQFYLDHQASDVARRLIEVYISFFKLCIKKGEVNSRMLSVLLMGLNRAYPYADLDSDKMTEHINTMYKLVHLANFNISVQCLTLLYQIQQDNISERFFSALYKKLGDPKLLNTTHQAMLLSLIYKTLLKDNEPNRIKMFVKRLFQISMSVQPNFACGILYLTSQIIFNNKNKLCAFILQKTNIGGFENNDTNDSDEDEKYVDVKIDVDDIKQEIDSCDEDETDLLATLATASSDVIEIKEEDVKPNLENLNKDGAGWCHRKLTKSNKNNKFKYDGFARNPLYGGGEFSAYTELVLLTNHYHPSVRLYAQNILDNNRISNIGDPLKDFTLIRFLERFVFKNPKKIDEKGAHPTFGKRKFYRPKGVRNLNVNSSIYLNENIKNIPVDEIFMYSYLQKKYESKIKSEDDESDLESVQSDEFEDMLDKMAEFNNAEEELNYLDDIDISNKQNAKVSNKKKLATQDEVNDDLMSENSDDIDSLEEEEDEFDDMNDSDKELLNDLSDDDEEDMQFDSDTEVKSKNKKKGGNSSIFASAEEFASILEDEGSSKSKSGTLGTFANKDNAHQKQLNWEEKRNRWLSGYKKAVGNKFSKGAKRQHKSYDKKSKKHKK